MNDVNMLSSDIEQEIRSSISSLLNDLCSPSRLVAMYDGDRGAGTDLWRAMRSELGLAGIMVPESEGGVGLTAREASVIMEELGRAVAPAPFLTSSVVATTSLLGSNSQLISQAAAGELTLALAVPFSTSHASDPPRLIYDETGLISGCIRAVAGAAEADVLLVPVDFKSRIALAAVMVADIEIQPQVSLDMTRPVANVIFDKSRGSIVLENAGDSIRRALVAGAAMLASEQAGLARWCLDTSLEYLKERRQFGRALGSFQALKHRLADLYVSVESASAAARYAALVLAEGGDDLEIAVSVAQAFCSDVAVHAGEEAVQLHAGMGMTWEHPAHLYLKRAKADQIAFGNGGTHRSLLAGLVDLQPAQQEQAI